MASAPGQKTFLPHLEGLRGIAVLAVLLFHAGVPGLGGGFVGVDVFFVLSGFLITGLLLREREGTGRISLAAFYGRRVRRILPAALVTIALTLLAVVLVLPPLDVPDIALDGTAAALSFGNIRFGLEATDYFAAGVPSPFLHYWSLGVEEQFYLVWPMLLILAARGPWPRLTAGLAIGAVFVASLAGAVWLTDVSAPWAFYSLPTRAWQLALGGLLAAGSGTRLRLPGAVAGPLGWLGIGGLAIALVGLDPATPYPGTAALLPTLASAAIIVAAARPGTLGRLLGVRPLRYLGRISYSLYLWHWPFIVLPALALGEELPLETRLALAGASVAVAAVGRRFIEEPFLVARPAFARPRRTVAVALSGAVALAVACTGVGQYALRQVDAPAGPGLDAAAAGVSAPSDDTISPADLPASPDATAPVDPAAAATAATAGLASAPGGPVSSAPGTIEGEPGIVPGGSPGSAAPSAGATPGTSPATSSPGPAPSERPREQADSGVLPSGVTPRLSAARDDKESLIRDGCSLGLRGSEPPPCVYGDPNGAVTVALVGDSHAAHWFPAFEVLAARHGWRLLPYTKASCVFLDMPVYSPDLKRVYSECSTWRRSVVERLAEEHPDLVVVSSARWFPVVDGRDDDPDRQAQAMARLLAPVPGRVVILADTPRSQFDVPVCLSAHKNDIAACSTPSDQAFTGRRLLRERAAARLLGAPLVDLSDAICVADPCPAVIDGVIVYRDHHHLTATFAAGLADRLDAALAPLIEPPVAPSTAPSVVPSG